MGWRAVRRSFAAAVVSAVALAAPAQAASTSFSSSLEAGDPQPTWTNTAERASGVIGPATGLPGNVTDTVVAVRASGENEDGGEVKENLVDGSEQSKWLVFEPTAWVELELADPVKVVRYALTSANDAAGRDPRDWALEGSNDGTTWTTLDTRSGEDFSERFQTKEYSFANDVAYRHYRLDITANHGDGLIQLAELQLSNGETARRGDMRSIVGAGPRGGYNAKSGVGFTGLHALQYAGRHTSEDRGYSYNKVFDVDVSVAPTTELSYLIYPDFERDDLSYPSTYAAVDLAFTDGTFLSDLEAQDQHGATLSPQGQGASKTLYTNQWNLKRSRIGSVAAGKTIDRVLVAYDNPDGPADFGGWIDDIDVGPAEPAPARTHPSDWVVTTRGTNSSGGFSRGNNIPATAVPHGFNFWTPVTNAGTVSWLYEYQKANNADNLPTLQAFSLSHEPSPWMGDRQTFQVMPTAATGTPDADRKARALPFRHANETAKPHYYSVRFDSGIKTEIAPTDHAAIMRFSLPRRLVEPDLRQRRRGTRGLVADHRPRQRRHHRLVGRPQRPLQRRDADVHLRHLRQADQGERDAARRQPALDGLRALRRRHGEHADRDVADRHRPGEAQPPARAGDRRHRRERQAARAEPLGREAFNGSRSRAPPRTSARRSTPTSTGCSSIPTRRTRTRARRTGRSGSTPCSPPPSTPPSSATKTGAPVVDGKVYVNNGFWDTYRTTWSAYSLFTPKMAGELVDGFVQQYRDGGWIARWSSPGYANLMTGTSSDAAFADAFVKGVPGLKARDTYDAAVKNATVAPPGDPWNPSIGRKGQIVAPFLGYTPSRVSEGVSWALEGDINDFGIANMAQKLATETEQPGAEAAPAGGARVLP